MIFVTVGTELPFDRLVHLVDEWARAEGRQDVFAQIGYGAVPPSHIGWRQFLEPPEFKRCFAQASIVIAHAGMGTILTALHAGKPLLVMPRRLHLGEHRSDHQYATGQHLREMGRINIAFSSDELRTSLAGIDGLCAGERIPAFASEELVGAVRSFIDDVAHQRTTPRASRHPFALRSFAR